MHQYALIPGTLSKAFYSGVRVVKTKGKPRLYRTRGPISAMLLWLEAGGRPWEGPAAFKSAEGGRWNLTDSPPRQIADAFVADLINHYLSRFVPEAREATLFLATKTCRTEACGYPFSRG